METAEQRLAGTLPRSVLTDLISRMYLTVIVNWLKSILHIASHLYFAPNNMTVTFLEATTFTGFYYLCTFDRTGGIILLVAQFVCSFMVYQTKTLWGTAIVMSLLMTWYPGFYTFMETQHVKLVGTYMIKMTFYFSMSKNNSYIIYYLGSIMYYYFRWDIPRGREDLILAMAVLGCWLCLWFSLYGIGEVSVIAFFVFLWMCAKSQNVPERYTLMRPDLLNVIHNE